MLRVCQSFRQAFQASVTTIRASRPHELRDADLLFLRGMVHVISLDLSGCGAFSDAGLSHLWTLPLTSLNLSDCSGVTPGGLKALLLALTPTLQSVDLSSNDWLTPDALLPLGGMPGLTSVVLYQCLGLEDEAIDCLEGLQLTSLTLGSECLTYKALENIEGMPLTSLSLACSISLTDAALKSLKGMPLEYLDLLATSFSDRGLKSLVGLPITTLDLKHCDQLTEACLPHLLGLPHLSTLYVAECDEDFQDEAERVLDGVKIKY